MEVVAARLAGGRVAVVACRGEDPLPRPGSSGAGVLSRKAIRQGDAAGVSRQIASVELLDPLQVVAKWSAQAFRKESDAVFSTFAIADDDLARGKVDVF